MWQCEGNYKKSRPGGRHVAPAQQGHAQLVVDTMRQGCVRAAPRRQEACLAVPKRLDHSDLDLPQGELADDDRAERQM